jgi:hypothetical protein
MVALSYNLEKQLQYLQIGKDESIETELDMVRSEYQVSCNQALQGNSNAGVSSNVDFTMIGGSKYLASNRVFNVKSVYIANQTAAAHAWVTLYDSSNSADAAVTMAGFALFTMGASLNNSIFLDWVEGLIFSSGYIVAQCSQSNAQIVLGGIIRPKTTGELQSTMDNIY